MTYGRPGIAPASLFLALILAGAGQGVAQVLGDPTRPPGVASPAGADGGAQGGEPVLQAVVLESGRKHAVISGRIVRLGERYEGARLVQITGSEVTLREGRRTKTLKLVPGIDKRPARTKTGAKGGGG